MNASSERRDGRRIDIRLPVVYRGPDGMARPGSTANLSRGGLLLIVREPASRGESLRVAVTRGDGRDCEVTGQVVRTTTDGRVAVSLDPGESLESLLDTGPPPGG